MPQGVVLSYYISHILIRARLSAFGGNENMRNIDLSHQECGSQNYDGDNEPNNRCKKQSRRFLLHTGEIELYWFSQNKEARSGRRYDEKQEHEYRNGDALRFLLAENDFCIGEK